MWLNTRCTGKPSNARPWPSGQKPHTVAPAARPACAPGAVSSTSTDAVNGSQLFAVSEVANAGWNISDGTSSGNIAPDETLTVTAGSNAEVTYDDATSTLTVGVVADPSVNSITVGDTVIWDNRTSLHRATPYDPDAGRMMHRTILQGTEAWEN